MSIESWMWNDKERLEYCDAMEYLYDQWGNFPSFIPHGGPTAEISRPYYKNWRFILTPENEVVFANCIIQSINAETFIQFSQTMDQKVWL